ncbi:arginase [Halovenus sp. WSH3]|uniref:Arginase n=1 Tax=Halovenus carboxidivorans TaxID=2692199 RepID=A0A6B0SZT7_9EURY|nr:arginase [Halovenus carboxidivorans]MXR51388.1 arginase [Halovenus carboxidivorans]
MDQPVDLIGVPMDLGADRRGVDMGPSAIRYGGLRDQLESLGIDCTDSGDIGVPQPEHCRSESDIEGEAKYLDATQTVCEQVSERVREIRATETVPLVLGGDHSIAIGTAHGVTDRPTGLLWLDAHADLNTPTTTPSGNVHGMALAAILGEGPFSEMDWAHAPNIRPENVAVVGLRSVDPGERSLLESSPIHAYTMTDIDQRGISTVVREALEAVTTTTDQLAVSLDLDLLDPSEAPGVGTPVKGGASYREAHAAMEIVAETSTDLCSLELVEVNPILDESNRTAELACELAASALGKRVL